MEYSPKIYNIRIQIRKIKNTFDQMDMYFYLFLHLADIYLPVFKPRLITGYVTG
jgi:hypothetical protein